jgi:uncharacterized protein (TIGR00266 family)
VKYEIRYKPSFASIFVTLAPGESITAEAGAMTSMDSRLTIETKFSGGLIPALLKSFLGGESMFINIYTNRTNQPLNLALTQSAIGDIDRIDLAQLPSHEICFQQGAYIGHTEGVKIGVAWAGLKSWFAGEGLFKLKCTGNGRVFFGCYGGLTQKRINGDFVVDNSHLVAYEPGIKMNLGLSGGLVGSVTSGEGFVNRLSGNGLIYLQSRSISGLVKYLRPKMRF